jgi:hypothetical protein
MNLGIAPSGSSIIGRWQTIVTYVQHLTHAFYCGCVELVEWTAFRIM